MLWAIGPMMVSIRKMTGVRNGLSIPIAVVVSAAVLISRSVFGVRFSQLPCNAKGAGGPVPARRVNS
jgi:hypothetical protein